MLMKHGTLNGFSAGFNQIYKTADDCAHDDFASHGPCDLRTKMPLFSENHVTRMEGSICVGGFPTQQTRRNGERLQTDWVQRRGARRIVFERG